MKKTLAYFLAITLITALLCVPTAVSAAETYHGMTFDPPANYYGEYDSEDDSISYYAEDDDYTECSVYLTDSDIDSVKQWSEYEWSNWIMDWRDGNASDISVSFESIAGYDFVKIDYTDEYEGNPWYNTFYNGGPNAQYCFYYSSLFAFLPYYDEFEDMVHSVSFGGSAPANDVIKIYVNGVQVHPDADPFIMNDRTFIPLCAAAEAMGCAVDWDGNTRSVFITSGGQG